MSMLMKSLLRAPRFVRLSGAKVVFVLLAAGVAACATPPKPPELDALEQLRKRSESRSGRQTQRRHGQRRGPAAGPVARAVARATT